MAVQEITVTNILVLTQTVKTNLKGLVVEQFVPFTQKARHNIRTRGLIRHLPLDQRVDLIKSISLSVSNKLQLSHTAQRLDRQDIQQQFFIWHEALVDVCKPAQSVLTLTQSVSVDLAKATNGLLTLTQSVQVNVIRALHTTNQFGVIGEVAGYKSDPRFTPSVSVGIERALVGLTFTLTYGPTVINMKSPDFGNVERQEVARISRLSRGGDVQIYRDDMWPKTHTFSYTFSNLDRILTNVLLVFMRISLGKPVLVRDHFGINRIGIILTPAAEVAQQGITNNTLKIEFQEVT
jgi:hypothetical protein